MSEATALYRTLATDRQAQVAGLKEHIKNSPAKAALVDDIERRLSEGDFWSKEIRLRARRIIDWLLHDGTGSLERDPRRIISGSVFGRDSFARVSAFSDRSGLVLVSGTLGPSFLYSAQLASLLRPYGTESDRPATRRLIGAVRGVRHHKGSAAHQDHERLAVVLWRYSFVNERIYGSPRRLKLKLKHSDRWLPVLLSDLAMYFVLAHEIAHFVLGHVGQEIPDRDRRDFEFAADEMAYRIVHGLFRGLNAGKAMGRAIRLVFLQMEALDSALSIRGATTHPEPAERCERLSLMTEDAELLRPNASFSSLEHALNDATNIRSPISESWWELLARASPIIREKEDVKRCEATRLFDVWQGRSDSQHLGVLDQAEQEGTAGLGRCVRLAWDDSPLVALTELGLGERTVQVMCDRSSGLSFYSLARAITASNGFAEHIDTTERLMLAVSAVSLLQPTLA